MIVASVWPAVVDVALGLQAALVLYLLRAVWRLERRVDELERDG